MLIRSGLILAVGILLGRLLGFFRETLIASQFGVSGLADVAILTLTLPDLFMNVLLGGAASIVLVPVFVRLQGAGSAWLHYRISIISALVCVLLAVVVVMLSQPLARLLAPGVTPQTQTQIALGISWSAWLMPLIACATVTTTWLQALGRFSVSAFSTLLYNLVLIFVLMFALSPTQPIVSLAIGMLIAGVLRCFWLWWDTHPFVNHERAESLMVKPLLQSYGMALVASSSLFLLPLIGRAMASQTGEGGIAIFNYASKLVELPLAVAITLIANVMFATLAHTIQQQPKTWSVMFGQSQRVVILVAWLITLPAFCFSLSLVKIAFGWGEISEFHLQQIAIVWQCGLLSLVLQGVVSLNTVALAAHHNTRTLASSSLLGLVSYSGASYLLLPIYGLLGLMGALLLAYLIMLIEQWRVLVTRHHLHLSQVLNVRFLCTLMLMLLITIPMWFLGSYLNLHIVAAVFVAIAHALLLLGVLFMVQPEIWAMAKPLLRAREA